ncbi:GGDEF domain-containing protein [Aeromicrobium yanjiei]|uniref:Diguanylate cyclase n=1 Tax=Aeromicrobium yanjiei TaxID=2662028 RepID=A0A5Q2MED3_9ACTN|nr:sensor domain-containing diguanylate cyclase [Aeromicrobium yanjiei]QGG40011.1 diguanylate cyclase [Aeromicrobium yanjiei]
MGRETHGLQSLAAMAHLLMQPHSLERVLEVAAEHARGAIGAASVSISQFDEPAQQIRTILNVGELGPGEERWPDDETYSIAGDKRLASAILDKLSSHDAVDDPSSDETERRMLRRLEKGSSLTTAIVVDGRAWGEFYATRHIGAVRFDADSIAYAEVLVAILASAISRALREQTLQELAFHDPLTGLFNRRGLDAEAAQVFNVPEGTTRNVAIVVVDINGLKTINDTQGHAQGDERIRFVGSSLRIAFAPLGASIVARVGGDEFTVMVPDRDVREVLATADALLDRLAEAEHEVGVSAGVAAAAITADTDVRPTDLFAAADRAQYVAKRAGLTAALLYDDLEAQIA